MCGIVGIIQKKQAVEESVLRNMTQSLAHRGPDHQGMSMSVNDELGLGLGHRRLAVIDTSTVGNQPMKWNDLELVFNGEIYNYISIRNELIEFGHHFETRTDTEVILHAYRQWGLDFINKLDGMFALCLHDYKLKESFLFRDRLGVKPLYCYSNSKCFLFASELKAFHHHPWFVKQLDLNAVRSFFQYGNVPGSQSIFLDVFKLNPGSYLKFSWSTFEHSQTVYWDPAPHYEKPKLSLSYQEAKVETLSMLKQSILARTISDVPLGVFLSSGYDSSMVAAILANEVGSTRTYTVSIPSIGFNEAPAAQKIADYLGTNHTEVNCDIQQVLEVIPKLAEMYDEPFADSSAIPTYLVSVEARKDITVALSADGGDELFGGYNRHRYFQKYAPILKASPAILRKSMAFGLNAVAKYPSFVSNQKTAQRLDKFSEMLKDWRVESFMESMTQAVTNQDISKYFLHAESTPIESLKHKLKAPYSDLTYMLWHDLTHYLPNDILHKVDRATMAAGLEGREPLLDHHLIEFVAQLPDEYKCTGKSTKIILKDLVHDHIPKDLMSSKKMGFSIPINDWMRSHLKEEIKGLASDEFLRNQAIFNADAIQKMLDLFFKGSNAQALQTWYFYVFQTWYNRWMVN